MLQEQFIQLVVNGLERIIFEGSSSSSNFVVFGLSVDPYFIQIAASRGDFSAHCEATGNGFMMEKDHISEEQIAQLLKLGWSEAPGTSNHTINLSCESIDDRIKLAHFFFETAKVYGSSEITEVDVHIDT